MPPLPPPPVYVPTSELKEGSVASFAATVLHFAAPAPTKGTGTARARVHVRREAHTRTGLLVKLKVADGTGVEPVSVLIFRNRATELPVVTAVGDILCFTHMRVRGSYPRGDVGGPHDASHGRARHPDGPVRVVAAGRQHEQVAL